MMLPRYGLSVVVAAVIALGLSAGRLLAAPPNDAFAARIDLGSAPVVAATGSTVAATLEADENDLDSLGGCSVWWKWTSPVTGWVVVETAGSGIDTVLAVMADGPALDDTYVVGFNDESGDPDATPGSSRVIFSATSGTEYHLAVHGFLGAQGPVAVRVRTGVVPPLQVRSLALSPASVNVTAVAAEVTVDIGIDSEADFAEGVLIVHRADFSGSAEVPIAAAGRVAGTARSGVYRVAVPVARYSPPGTWLLEVAASDTRGREAVFGRGVSAGFEYDHVMPDGAAGFFSVSNGGAVDDVAPVVAGFSRSPAVLDVTSGPGPLVFSFRVMDALSGFGSATLTVLTPSGEALTALAVTSAHRTSGTALDGTYTVPFLLPAKMPGGLWTVSLLVRDAAGTPALYDGAVAGEDFPLGAASAAVAVTGAPHGYHAWMYPLLDGTPGTAPDDDFDGDGLSNLLEFAFGLSMSTNDSGAAAAVLPAASLAGDALTLTFVRRAAAADNGVDYHAQFSAEASSAGPGGWRDATGGVVEPLDGTWERVRLADPQPGGTRRFGRVQVRLRQ